MVIGNEAIYTKTFRAARKPRQGHGLHSGCSVWILSGWRWNAAGAPLRRLS